MPHGKNSKLKNKSKPKTNNSKNAGPTLEASLTSKIAKLDSQIKALVPVKTETITPFVLDEKYVPPPVLTENDITQVMNWCKLNKDSKQVSEQIRSLVDNRIGTVISDVKTKVEAKSTASAAEMALIKSIQSRMSVGKNSTTLWVHERQQPVSAVGGAMTQVLTLTPLNLVETKAIAPLYDLVRCKGLKFRVHTSTVNNVGVPANPTLVADGIFVFDYGVSAVLVNVAQGMEFQHHIGPIAMSGSGYANSPGADSLHGGFAVSDFIKETKTVDPGLVTDLLGGNWVASSDTGVIVGYIKSYCEGVGAAVASTANVYISYLLEYKHRG